jgi:tetratricopeptide (TPR) repeat protein
MPKILISEQKPQPTEDSFAVKLKFDDIDEFEGLTIQNPFTAQNEAKLEWHFESYVSFPYLKEVEPQEAQEIIKQAGENLFSKIFGQPQIYSRYQQILNNGLNNLVIEISGSPEFHSLHWEALKDRNLPTAFALDVPILRKDLKPQPLPAVSRETSTINLLVVTSRPQGRRDVSYRTISRPLVELIRNSQLPVKIDILRPGTYEALSKHLDNATAEHGKGFYHVVHFDVHGALLTYQQFEKIEGEKIATNLTYQIPRYGRPEIKFYEGKDAFLFFDDYHEPEKRDDDGFRADAVRADELSNLLLTHGIPIVILNACQSAMELGEQERESNLPVAEETSLASRLMRAGAQMVLAMSYSVTVTAAEILMKSFYQELFRGKTLNRAIQIGRKELANRKQRRAAWNYQVSLEDWLLPVVYQKQNVELKTARLTPQEEEQFNLAQQEISQMPEVEYGFYGRDIDILNIERRVLLKNNILLIRGMGGAGKTTLLRHLSWWWRATNFVQKVFYFGYDEKAYTRQEIMFSIAEKLYDRFEFAAFQAMDEQAQQQKLAKKLRTERHLLILDNLESIQGGYFAVKNTLSAEEQAKLKAFLAELRGAVDPFQEQTIVLLGSRSAEEWLAEATFKKNVYDLGGLDAESTTQFAEEILRQNEVSHYRNEEDFKKLLKLLAGFPLPMKEILRNLKQQTPSEILAALQAGDVNFRTGTAEEKTKDILKCIEYSHRNIAPEKKELLLCLAPFTSVINRNYFDLYIEELKKHENLAHLKHELWDEVFKESIERGLISQNQKIPFVFHLQPILPYFLKTEWQKDEMNKFKKAIQLAFRNFYDNTSHVIAYLIDSNDANQNKIGHFLTSLEFENIVTCLEYAVAYQTSVLNPFLTLSRYYDNTKNNQAGLELSTKVLDKLKNYSSEILEGEMSIELTTVLDDIARRQLLLMKYVDAEISYQKVIKLNNSNNKLTTEEKLKRSATIYHQLGRLAQEQRKWRESEESFKKALQLFIDFKVYDFEAKTLFQLGMIYHQQEKLDGAEKYYQQALEKFIKSNALHDQASVFHKLGMIKRAQKEWEKAEEYYQQTIQIYSNFNERFLMASTFHELGVVFHEQHYWNKAELNYRRALEIYIEFKDTYEQGSVFGQLGLLKKDQAQFKESLSYLLQTLKIFRDFADHYNTTIAIYNLRSLWLVSNDNNLITEVGKVLGITEIEVRKIFDQL